MNSEEEMNTKLNIWFNCYFLPVNIVRDKQIPTFSYGNGSVVILTAYIILDMYLFTWENIQTSEMERKL